VKQQTPATAGGRAHPFVPVLDPNTRRAGSREAAGPLILKGIFGDKHRVAIIKQGSEIHFVREGESVGGLKVLTIAENDVVLSATGRKQILSLYATCVENVFPDGGGGTP
jgi:type II secretory pathway component PulC